MATTSYLLSFNSENSMYSTWICVKLCLVEDSHHRCLGARQWRRVRIAFHAVVIPLMSSQIRRFSLRNRCWSCTLCLSVCSEHLTQTIFICIVDSISRRDMVHTLPIKFPTVNIVKLLTRILACIYFIIHRIRQTIFYNQFMTFRRYAWRFI